jgi:nickel-dependent lactate racemase
LACGGLASARLIGTTLLPGKFLAQEVSQLRGSAKSLVISTHEFYGNLDERIDFPNSWEINEMRMKGQDAPVLSPQEIRQEFAKPIGTPPLRELAAGKRRVVITFDDLTRGTPTYDVIPSVIDELRAAGVADENILLMVSLGSHRAMHVLEVQRKIGKDIEQRFVWINHNVVSNFDELGTTSYKNRIRVNSTFAASDLKITLSGIRVHEMVGYGGGAKAVLPGVSSLDTIEFNHINIGSGNPTVGPFKVFKNEQRKDMIEAARLAKLDFSVNIVYNGKQKPIGVFAGDVAEAHHAACRVANSVYRTPTFHGADIVVSNAYPYDAAAGGAQSWIRASLREGGTGVLVAQNPVTMESVHYLNQKTRGQKIHDYWQDLESRTKSRPRGSSGLIVYSQYLDRQMMNGYGPGTMFASTWAEVIQLLQKRHKSDARVAVYPYGGLQHEEVDLDG